MKITEHYAWTHLPEASQYKLLSDAVLMRKWLQREQIRVADSFTYAITNYGVITRAGGAGPEPFGPMMWKAQKNVMIPALEEHDRDLLVLKTRRFGFTSIVAHYFGWKAGLSRQFPGAKEIAISVGQRESDEFIEMVRLFLDELPPFLKPVWGIARDPITGRRGRDTISYIKFAQRRGAAIRALPSSGARSFMATDLFLDELAHYPNMVAGSVVSASRSIIEGGGRSIIGSSGNRRMGDGKVFADLIDKAIAHGD